MLETQVHFEPALAAFQSLGSAADPQISQCLDKVCPTARLCPRPCPLARWHTGAGVEAVQDAAPTHDRGGSSSSQQLSCESAGRTRKGINNNTNPSFSIKVKALTLYTFTETTCGIPSEIVHGSLVLCRFLTQQCEFRDSCAELAKAINS